MDMLLKNKVALVTGASKGIGRRIAVEMARQGADLAINYNTDCRGIEETATEIAKYGKKALLLQADISNRDAAAEIVKKTKDEFKRIDILVNNAGVLFEKYLFRISDDEWQRCFQVNVDAACFCSRACLLSMLRQGSGKIINISSLSGVSGNTGHTAYGASKAALIGFTKSLAKEVARKNINVNAIAPGYIDTGMTAKTSGQSKEILSGRIPCGRMGSPEEVAKTVVFLASELSSYIHGEVIVMDGGLTI